MHKPPLHQYAWVASWGIQQKGYPIFLPSLIFGNSWITSAKVFQKFKLKGDSWSRQLLLKQFRFGKAVSNWKQVTTTFASLALLLFPAQAGIIHTCLVLTHPFVLIRYKPRVMNNLKNSGQMWTSVWNAAHKKWKHVFRSQIPYMEAQKFLVLFKYVEKILLHWSANLCLDFCIVNRLSNPIHFYFFLLLIPAFLISLHLEAPTLPIPLTILIALSLKSIGLCKLPLCSWLHYAHYRFKNMMTRS